MDSLALALRVGLSLACVLGLVWLFSKGAMRGGARRSRTAAGVTVLARHSLSRSGSVAVVQVGERALVLGVTEQHVTLLHETDLATVSDAVADPEAAAAQFDPAALALTGSAAATAPPAVAPTAVEPAVAAAVALPAQRRRGATTAATGPLAGSALSPATWSQAVEVLRERTTRR